jgi:tetratricopeptide (TPR) repeat protein
LTVGAARLLYKNGRSSTIGDAGRWTCATVAFAPVIGLTAAQGGYFPTSWGWASVPLLWATAIVLVVRTELRVSNAELLFAGTLVAFSAWVALSIAWSSVPAESVLEAERTLVYVAGVGALLVLSRESDVWVILASVLGAITLIALFSLATRLFPDRIGVYDRTAVYRLAQPVGYWNGLALFVAMGSLLAFAFAARATSIPVRGICAGILVFLLPTLYFTFGRAAWIALLGGVLGGVAVDRHRLQLLAALVVLGSAPAVAVWVASRERGLTHAGTSLERAAHDGHRLALVLVILAAVNATAAAAFVWGERHIQIGEVGRRVAAGALALAALGLVLTVFGQYGGPVALAKRGYSAFTAPPPHVTNLNQRLLNFSGNGRADLWRIAWHEARRHPGLGAGAGAYERYFLTHQPANVGRVRDAHGLYIETLAELGPIGLAILIAALVVPLTLLQRARRHPLVPVAAGAYVAYLVHTGVDWDWELPAVTLVGLLCGASILLLARQWRPPRPLSPPTRFAFAAVAVAAAGFAAIALLGNSALSRSETARAEGRLVRAATDARRARALMPWSPKPWEALGRAQLAAGLFPDARRSFRKAISMDDGDWRLWYDLAGASTGRAERRALRHAVALFPRSGLLVRASSPKR